MATVLINHPCVSSCLWVQKYNGVYLWGTSLWWPLGRLLSWSIYLQVESLQISWRLGTCIFHLALRHHMTSLGHNEFIVLLLYYQCVIRDNKLIWIWVKRLQVCCFIFSYTWCLSTVQQTPQWYDKEVLKRLWWPWSTLMPARNLQVQINVFNI